MASFCRKPHIRKNIGSRDLGPKRPKNGYFRRLISRERKELSKICFDFRNPQSFFYEKCHRQISVSPPLHPENWGRNRYRKTSQNRFFNFLELCWSDFVHIAGSIRGPLGLTLAKISCRLPFRFWICVHFCKTDPKTVQKLDFSTPFRIF